jgi:hypothetical protein
MNYILYFVFCVIVTILILNGINYAFFAKPKVVEGAKNIFNEITRFFKKIGHGFDEIGEIFKKIVKGFQMIQNVFNCIGKVFKSIGSYIDCGVNKIKSLPSCFLYYMLDTLYYIFIGIPVWFLEYVFPPLKKIFDFIGGLFMKIDNFVHKTTKFHVFKYQDSVLGRCYTCNITPFPNFKNLAEGCRVKDETPIVTSCDAIETL